MTAAHDSGAAPPSVGREARSGRNVQSAYMVKPSTSGGDAAPKPANWNATNPNPNKRQRSSDPEDGTATPGPNTPATTTSGGTPIKPTAAAAATATATGAGSEPSAAAAKKRAIWSGEAVALGYETGTIKHSAYVLLALSGVTGMTVAAIVEAATKQG
jgi:hypothetical protein